ncbi:unnamed protein product [Diabrotica balteata]|uniref:Uncharacterized protein n=1 Tax=Diabrotica balteata TaxID=107213 RepID=A0A9N9T3F6_DIABA|nr:unnamed protein product [Diabrotica balteata]
MMLYSASIFQIPADESGCEADMAEGSIEEDSSEMLGPTLAPVLHTMQTSTPSNLSCKEEEAQFTFISGKKFLA